MSDNRTPHDGGPNEPLSRAGDPELISPSNHGDAPVDTEPEPGRRKRVPHKGPVRRHPVLLAVATLLVLITGTTGGYLWYLNNQLNNIQHVDAGIAENPLLNGHESGKPLNILLLGADNGDGQKQSVAQDMADGKWTPGAHRSDTMMIAHIPADRKSIQLVSIPRDTWVKIQGYPYNGGFAKINAAFSYGGPRMARQTVESLTSIHIDHLAIIDWAGFKDLTTALGGIRVYIPQTFYDDSQRITWEKGWHTFEGQQALAYVRTRHGLQNGDFDRIKRQQNFIRATMSKVLSGGTTHNPFQLSKVVGVITRYLTVDNTWDNGEIRSLALAMRSIHTENVDFLTAPFGSYDTSNDGQSIVRLAPAKSKALFQAVAADDVQSYLDKYPKAALAGSRSIN